MIRATILGAVLLAGFGAAAARAETIRLSPLTFDLPLGLEEKIPKGIGAQDIFVSDDFCFYYRLNGQFYFIDCVG